MVEESYAAYAKAFGEGAELLEVGALREAFDRPAFVDDFHHELSISDFLSALTDTVLFLQTGYLRDRISGQLLRGSYPLEMLPAGEFKKLRAKLLKEVKSLRAEAIADKNSGQLNASRASEYNARRYAPSARGDQYGRTSFARQIGNLLTIRPGSPGIVVGIEGPWGSGKSSIIEMIKNDLSGMRESGPIIVQFSPWMLSGSEALVEALLTELAAGINEGAEESPTEKTLRVSKRILGY
uniref:KAP NTPase domain-containing protein n=1 Tax=Anopheles culicifacies TaxID=139723 RepID=A0A182MFM4_9DIPT